MKELSERFLLPLGIDVATLMAIHTLYMDNPILTGVLAAIFLLALLFRFSRFKLVLAAFATLFGSSGEILCAAPGIELWVYKNPSYWNIPSWLPMIWPILMMTFVEMATYIHDCLVRRVQREVSGLLVRLAMTLVLVYAMYTFIHIQWVIASVFLVFLILMLVFARGPYNIVLFWMGAFGGSLGEYLCIRSGVWFYTRPFFADFGVPLSLPLAWGLSANIILMLTRASLGRRRGQVPGSRAADQLTGGCP